MSSNIQIEKLAVHHWDCWKRLWRLYLEFYETSREDEIFHLTFRRLTDDTFTDCEGFIALCNGQGVGLVNSLYHIHLWQEKKICYLQDLFVDKNFRYKGIGGKLISRVYDRTDELGFEGVYWTTQDFNTGARKLYNTIGTLTPFIKYIRS